MVQEKIKGFFTGRAGERTRPRFRITKRPLAPRTPPALAEIERGGRRSELKGRTPFVFDPTVQLPSEGAVRGVLEAERRRVTPGAVVRPVARGMATPVDAQSARVALSGYDPAFDGLEVDKATGTVVRYNTDGTSNVETGVLAQQFRQYRLNQEVARDILTATFGHNLAVDLFERQSALSLQLQTQRLGVAAEQSALDRSLRARELEASVEHNRALREFEQQRLAFQQQQFKLQVLLSLAGDPFLLRSLRDSPVLQMLVSGLGLSPDTLAQLSSGGPPGGIAARPQRQIVEAR